MINHLGPMAGTVVVVVIPPGTSARMAIAETAGACPGDTVFHRERNLPMPTRGDNGLTFKKKVYFFHGINHQDAAPSRGRPLPPAALLQPGGRK